MLKRHNNFVSDTFYAKHTFLWVCLLQKSDFDKETFIFVNAENKSLIFVQCLVLSDGMDSNIADLIINIRSKSLIRNDNQRFKTKCIRRG